MRPKGDGREPSAEIDALLRQGDTAAAVRLQELAESRDKALSKAARRALYRLKLTGVAPPESALHPRVPSFASAPSVASRALMSSYDGSGGRMLLFTREDPYGGSPTLLTFLTNDESGVKDLGGRRMPRRELEENLARFRDDDNSLLSDVDLDYGRWALKEAAARNAEARTPLPDGYAELARQVGEPVRDYAVQPIYEMIDPESVRSDLSISHSPQALFERPVFRPWLLPLERTAPWMERFLESQRSMLVLDKSQLARLGDRTIDEATDSLMAGSAPEAWKRRLEDTALVLHIAGRTEEAREAVYQALTLSSPGAPHTNAFLRHLVNRSVQVAIALAARDEEEAEEQEAPSLIHRI